MFPTPREIAGNGTKSASTFTLTVYNALRQWNGTSIRITIPSGTSDADISAMRRELSSSGWQTSVTTKVATLGNWKYLDIDAEEPTGA